MKTAAELCFERNRGDQGQPGAYFTTVDIQLIMEEVAAAQRESDAKSIAYLPGLHAREIRTILANPLVTHPTPEPQELCWCGHTRGKHGQVERDHRDYDTCYGCVNFERSLHSFQPVEADEP